MASEDSGGRGATNFGIKYITKFNERCCFHFIEHFTDLFVDDDEVSHKSK